MAIYRLTPPGERVEADSARQEGIHLVLRGMTLVIGPEPVEDVGEVIYSADGAAEPCSAPNTGRFWAGPAR